MGCGLNMSASLGAAKAAHSAATRLSHLMAEVVLRGLKSRTTVLQPWSHWGVMTERVKQQEQEEVYYAERGCMRKEEEANGQKTRISIMKLEEEWRGNRKREKATRSIKKQQEA